MKEGTGMHGRKTRRVGAARAVLTLALLAVAGTAGTAAGVSRFSSGAVEKRIPAPVSLEEIWFYDGQGKKIVPEIGLEWLSVVFRAEAAGETEGAPSPLGLQQLEEKSRQLVQERPEFEEPFCDTNLLEEGCFLKLAKGMDEARLALLIQELAALPEVDYVHPTLEMDGKTYAFFNALDLKWKTGVDTETMGKLLVQAHALPEPGEDVCRVDLFETTLFRAVNLLAEDIHVARATPVLVEIRPSIRAVVSLDLPGGSLGDKIPFSYTVTFSERIEIDPSSLANLSLRPDNIQKELFEMQLDPFDYVKAVRSSPIRISGWIQFFAPGEYRLPPLRLKYTCTTCSGTRERTFETEMLPVRIASILPSEGSQNKLIVPETPLEPPDLERPSRAAARRSLLEALGFLVAALAAVAWVAFGAVRSRRAALAAAERKDEVLAAKLRSLLAAGPDKAHWLFVEEATALFRQFLRERYGDGRGPSGGSGEIFFESIRESLPSGIVPAVQDLLREADRVVALEQDPYPDLDGFRERMRRLVPGSALG